MKDIPGAAFPAEKMTYKQRFTPSIKLGKFEKRPPISGDAPMPGNETMINSQEKLSGLR